MPTIEKSFSVKDPYNPRNVVDGVIYRDIERYGNIHITSVNGHPVDEYIETTPKFYYPGHHQSPRHEFKEADFPDSPFSVFEKLDGTNILMFVYHDHEGRVFTSFKTRLVPFLRQDGFKDWILMWKQAVDKHPDILPDIAKLPGNHAFEMYGYLNEILIKYDVNIDFRYLYTVDGTGTVKFIGTGEPVGRGAGRSDALVAYNKFVMEAERQFKDGKRAEGFVFYFDDGTVYKCKPICVVEEQGDSPFIGDDDIYVTAMNAAESIDTIDELLDVTKTLLAEVYDTKKMERSEPRIITMVEVAKQYLIVQKSAMDVMKELGFIWSDDNKATIMRAIMQRFPKSMSSKVYGMLSGKKPTKK